MKMKISIQLFLLSIISSVVSVPTEIENNQLNQNLQIENSAKVQVTDLFRSIIKDHITEAILKATEEILNNYPSSLKTVMTKVFNDFSNRGYTNIGRIIDSASSNIPESLFSRKDESSKSIFENMDRTSSLPDELYSTNNDKYQLSSLPSSNKLSDVDKASTSTSKSSTVRKYSYGNSDSSDDLFDESMSALEKWRTRKQIKSSDSLNSMNLTKSDDKVSNDESTSSTTISKGSSLNGDMDDKSIDTSFEKMSKWSERQRYKPITSSSNFDIDNNASLLSKKYADDIKKDSRISSGSLSERDSITKKWKTVDAPPPIKI